MGGYREGAPKKRKIYANIRLAYINLRLSSLSIFHKNIFLGDIQLRPIFSQFFLTYNKKVCHDKYLPFDAVLLRISKLHLPS